MPSRARSLAIATVSALALSFGTPASADFLTTIGFDAKGGVGQLETLTWTFNGASHTGLAGTVTATTIPGGKTYDAYCIDLYHEAYLGSTWDVDIKSLSAFKGDVDVPAGDDAGGNAAGIGYLYDTYASGVSTAVEGAALQIAIWKVDYDNSGDLSTGSFQFAATADPNSIQSQVFDQATLYLAGFDASHSTGDASFFQALTHPGGQHQDLVGPVNAVPEPTSLLMVATGLFAAARLRRPRPAPVLPA